MKCLDFFVPESNIDKLTVPLGLGSPAGRLALLYHGHQPETISSSDSGAGGSRVMKI